MNAQTFNWQQKGWPKATCNRAALRDELKAFAAAFRTLKKAGFTKDALAEGVAQMMLAVREKWNAPLTARCSRHPAR